MVNGAPAVSVIHTKSLFAMRVEVAALLCVGGPPGLGRRVGPITGGTVDGARIRGTILPNGSDWQIERSDGALTLDGRIVISTEDGALIAMTYTGLRHGPADTMARLNRGENVDATSYYFRIAARFSTSAPRYEWVNRILAFGVGDRGAHGPLYEVYEII
jgi:hypothetical protein